MATSSQLGTTLSPHASGPRHWLSALAESRYDASSACHAGADATMSSRIPAPGWPSGPFQKERRRSLVAKCESVSAVGCTSIEVMGQTLSPTSLRLAKDVFCDVAGPSPPDRSVLMAAATR